MVNESNMFEWEVMLMISDDCKYYGGTFVYSSFRGFTVFVSGKSRDPSRRLLLKLQHFLFLA